MKEVRLSFLLSTLFSIASVYAQTPILTITSASLNINPQSTDSYTLQGTFNGLAFNNAQSVTLSLGQFSGTIPINSFVQTPGTNILQYQDHTGQTPYWLSSLTIDRDAQTFTAQATGIVLAGLNNPFAVQLATDQTAACSMAGVQITSDGSYQLTPGDGSGEPCLISTMPALDPIPAGTQSSVTVTIPFQPIPFFDYSSFQLFMADSNGQPSGSGLCTFTDNGDGTYSCTAQFNPNAPGPIPLLIQARAFGATILSPGFSVEVVDTSDNIDMNQMSAIRNAISQLGQNFHQFGDSAYARIQALLALRALFPSQSGLTGQPVALAQDGLSISVRADAGLTSMIVLNDLEDTLGVASGGARALRRRAPVNGTLTPHVKPAQANAPPKCGQFARDIVQNNNVLIWDPGTLFFAPIQDPAPFISANLAVAKCPKFTVKSIQGQDADPNSLDQFPNYGTIIMFTHGGIDVDNRAYFETGQQGILPGLLDFVHYGWAYSLAPDGKTMIGPFVTVYGNNPHVHALQNTVIFAASCNIFQPSMYNYFAPVGSHSAFYGFAEPTDVRTAGLFGSQVFNSLVVDYSSTLDAWSSANQSAPSQNQALHMWYDGNLAYLGNPKLFSPTSAPPFTVPAANTLTLQAQLDGAGSCDGIMNYHWQNTAFNGDLSPSNGGSGSDDYEGIDSLAKYITNSSLTGNNPSDQIKVDFAPDLSNTNGPAVAAEACTTIQNKFCISVIGNNMGAGCTSGGSAGGPWTLTLTTLPQDTPYGIFTITFAAVPTAGSFGIASGGIMSASATVSPNGLGNSPTYTMSCTQPFLNDPDCGFVLQLSDMSDPTMPHGNVVTSGTAPDLTSISLNFVF
jgi:hypothetical protein